MRRDAESEADVHAVLDPVADAVFQLHIRHDLRIPITELVQQPPQQGLEGGARANDA